MKITLILSVLCFYLMCLVEPTPSIDPYINDQSASIVNLEKKILFADTSIIDTHAYNQALLHTVHDKPTAKWPVKTVYPLEGAILPFNRVIAYYGNLYSDGMDILGAIPEDQMLRRLTNEVESLSKSDPIVNTIPSLHYIAVTAQRHPGPTHKYRLRMPYDQIDKVIEMGKKIDALVFLDIQVGHSTLESEIPNLRKYLMLRNVHLGIDPEYSMKGGEIPSTAIGTFDASDINYASEYLAQLVKDYNLPPKLLIVHRFTKEMVTNFKKIDTRPEVQIVMNIDGFGLAAKKINTYKYCIAAEPVQFTGFKVFYKNDTAHPQWPALMIPQDILKLYPAPIYIQYQ